MVQAATQPRAIVSPIGNQSPLPLLNHNLDLLILTKKATILRKSLDLELLSRLALQESALAVPQEIAVRQSSVVLAPKSHLYVSPKKQPIRCPIAVKKWSFFDSKSALRMPAWKAPPQGRPLTKPKGTSLRRNNNLKPIVVKLA